MCAAVKVGYRTYRGKPEMNVVSVLWWMLCIVLLFGCMVIVILGVIWIVNYELKELTGTDFVRKWMEKRNV